MECTWFIIVNKDKLWTEIVKTGIVVGVICIDVEVKNTSDEYNIGVCTCVNFIWHTETHVYAEKELLSIGSDIFISWYIREWIWWKLWRFPWKGLQFLLGMEPWGNPWDPGFVERAC